MSFSNFQKTELGFGLNSFNKPMEVSGPEAWAKEILTLMFMEPGTYPSDPNIGIGVKAELYHDFDYLKNYVVDHVQLQVDKYLPDIPFAGIEVRESEEDENIVIYVIKFLDTAGNITVAVAASKVNENRIDYSVMV